MTMDFDYLNYVTSTKYKKVNDKNFKPVSYLILKISFLTLFGCPNDSKNKQTDKQTERTYKLENKICGIF